MDERPWFVASTLRDAFRKAAVIPAGWNRIDAEGALRDTSYGLFT
jgi:hypothetical protein